MRKEATAKICIILVFLAILIVGLCVYDDYGISIDEPIQRQHSVISYREVNCMLLGREVYADFNPTAPLDQYAYKYYGVAMQLPLVAAEDCYKHLTGNEMGYRQIYLMRHLYTFLVYYVGLICFYCLLERLFNNRWLALAGVLMVYLFGRFFAQSFYNIKDMLFASLLMISLSCAERVLSTNRKPLWCLLFALCGALLVTSRIVGALLIVLVLLSMLIQDLLTMRHAKRAGNAQETGTFFKKALPYLLICCAYPLWIVATPAAWSDPIGFSLGYVQKFSDYDGLANCNFLFNGAHLWIDGAQKVPRGYLITWITLTAPIAVQLLCLLGIVAFLVALLSKKDDRRLSGPARNLFSIMLVIMAGTVLYQFLLQPLIYDGWRHAFYLYPMMAAFAVYGVWWLWGRARRLWLRVGIVCLLTGTLGYNAYRIASNHPNEYALFNPVGRSVAIGFDRDYWELSYSDLFRWLLANREGELRYTCGGTLDGLRVYMLKKDGGRLQFFPIEDADYVLTVFHEPNTNEFPIEGFTEIHAVWVDEVKLGAVYERIAE